MPRYQVDSIFMRPVLGCHRPMKSSESSGVGKIRQKRVDVAVADENLGMRFNLCQIKFFEQIVSAIATARAEDRPHIVAHEHLLQLARSSLGRSSEIKILFQDRVEIERPVPGEAQGFAACVQVWPLNITRGRDDTYGIAGAKGGRF